MTFEAFVDRVDQTMRSALNGAPDVTVVIQLDTDGPAQATWTRGGVLARVREFGPDRVSFSIGLIEDPELEAEYGTFHPLQRESAEMLGAFELTILFARPDA